MTSPVNVIWSAHSEGIYATRRGCTILPAWAGLAVNAETAAETVAQDFFDASIWQQFVGADDNDFSVTVEIHAPEEIAGIYEVELERVTRAKARKQPAGSQS